MQRQKRGGKRSKRMSMSAHDYDSQTLKGPKAFTLDRLLAIFYRWVGGICWLLVCIVLRRTA